MVNVSLVLSSESIEFYNWVISQVRQKYAEQYEFDAISNILGMDKSAIAASNVDKGGGFVAV